MLAFTYLPMCYLYWTSLFLHKAFNMSTYCLLASMLYFEDPLYMVNHCSLAAFKILSLFLAFNNLTIIVLIWFSLKLFYLDVTDIFGFLDSCLSSDLGNLGLLFLQIVFLPPFSLSSPSETPIINILLYLIEFHKSIMLCSLFFPFLVFPFASQTR